MSKEGYFASALGLLAIVVAILQAMYPVIPPYIGWPIVVVLGIAAIVLFIKGAGVKPEKLVLSRLYLLLRFTQRHTSVGETGELSTI